MNKRLLQLARVLSGFLLAFVFAFITLTAFIVGYVRGYGNGKSDTQNIFQNLLSNKVSSTSKSVTTPAPSASPTTIIKYVPAPTASWGGPQLWDAVNKRRVELGVNPLSVKDDLCTIASIRLNELLALGTLDGHTGFAALETRSDIKPIFDSYSNVSEFLVSGATSPENAVALWENTLGHVQLLNGGQYVWGCIYAQNGFGVAIAAY